jgi:hypothetical protein
MTSVTAILNELAKTLGHEAVRTACLQFAGKKPSATAAAAPEAPAKEKKPRGPNGWTKFVTSVLEELQAAAPEGTKVIRKEAMRVAGERWAEQKGPEALKAYRERQAKKAAAGGAASDSESELEDGELPPPPPPAPAKKPRGRPPKAKAAAAPEPASEHTEEEQEAFRFLFRLQESGRTNMFGAPAYLVRELGTDPTEAERLTGEYMGNYDALSKLYSVEAQKA